VNKAQFFESLRAALEGVALEDREAVLSERAWIEHEHAVQTKEMARSVISTLEVARLRGAELADQVSRLEDQVAHPTFATESARRMSVLECLRQAYHWGRVDTQARLDHLPLPEVPGLLAGHTVDEIRFAYLLTEKDTP
jgi:hypothetical protein